MSHREISPSLSGATLPRGVDLFAHDHGLPPVDVVSPDDVLVGFRSPVRRHILLLVDVESFQDSVEILTQSLVLGHAFLRGQCDVYANRCTDREIV